VSIRDAFIAAYQAITSWAVTGDVLVLSGPVVALEFVRDLPPIGDSARTLAATLRVGQWRITSATGVRSAGGLALALFSDHSLTSAGSCGFGSEVRFVPGGIDIVGVGWDTDGACRTGDLQALARVMDAVTSGRVDSPMRVRLTGPAGDVVLTRE
jgi:hypothetical protein